VKQFFLDFCCFQGVPTKFQMGSQQHLTLWLFAMLSSRKLHRWANVPTYTFILLEWILLYVEISKALELFFCYGPIRPSMKCLSGIQNKSEKK
jgi:hypothetical protein